MNNTRRGFLKTLGKLGAALGLTAAACSAHHHGHHHPQHPPKAKPRTARKAKGENTLDGYPGLTAAEQQWVRDGRKVMEFERPAPVVTFGDAPDLPNGRYPGGFTGFKKQKTEPLTYKALDETYQKAVVQGQIKFAGNVTVTNRPDVETAVEMTSRHQEWLNRITMARIDNISMTLNPVVLLKDVLG